MIRRAFVGFFLGLWGLPWHWRLWVGLLIAVNGVAPLFFLGTLEARVVLAGILAGAVLQMIVFGARGFVRLLGAGHLVFWIPMLLWLWPRLGEIGTESAFGRWLVAVIVIDLASLIIDATDVVRYALGDRKPSLTVEEME